jgi:hypothetical protein
VVGPGRDGRLLEVGYAIDESGRIVVFHAMSARRKSLDRLER